MFQNKRNHRYEYADRQPKLKIKKGQQVEVITGTDRGLRGAVLYVDAPRMRVLVRGVNLKTHFVKEKGFQKQEAFLHYSNVKLVDASVSQVATPRKGQAGTSKVQLSRAPASAAFVSKSRKAASTVDRSPVAIPQQVAKQPAAKAPEAESLVKKRPTSRSKG